MDRPKLLLFLACSSLVIGATACAAIWGFRDPLDPLDGVVDGAVADGRGADCSLDTVSTDIGVFVTSDGSTDPSCGSEATPCASIQTAINNAAKTAGKTFVYIAAGSYNEAITLAPNITVMGGWNEIKTGDEIDFVRACATPPGTAVTITAPDSANVTVLAENVAGAALVDLAIATKAKGAAGESVLGIVAEDNTSLSLTDVNVKSGNGGDGAPGAQGPIGTQGGPSCPASGNGGDADGGVEAGAGSAVGAFSDPGRYVSGNGSGGPVGIAGNAGAAPPDAGCLTCVTSCGGLGCTAQTSNVSCGEKGTIGCGGAGGGGGLGGQGGGATIALFTWNATVTITRGSLVAGNGGSGGAGGVGGPGGQGGQGSAGVAAAQCNTACGAVSLTDLCDVKTEVAPGGGAGTNGGAGAQGGQGGGGAGGPSLAIYKGGQSSVNVQQGATFLDHGSGGPGGDPGGGSGAAAVSAP